ncbi:hypothetical protein K443DRAFT_562861 [Laccaria amethystina LaAM-08-1]|uniref:DUF6533 domain-containing protein n=1 Tax=Laccaria amethystina LaAM-08-1 TaxID=1095629 RepID=A0A0C9Y3W0_9AGAR|nr:hypothetical protein K443DRAFT_562861 [Laccaria amethystina LaAM-08-1]
MENYTLVHYAQVAATVVTLYDHIITLDLEAELIWSKRWSKSKILFLICRYFGDGLLIYDSLVFLERNISQKVCLIGFGIINCWAVLIIWTSQIIMQLRIRTLYGKRVSLCLTLSFLGEITAVTAFQVISIMDLHYDVTNSELGTGVHMCMRITAPPYIFLFWIPILIFECLLFVLSLRIAYRNCLEVGNWRGASLLHVLLRDNFWHFVCAFAFYAVTAVTWLTVDPRYWSIPSVFAYSMTITLGCRLVLNLCDAFHHPRGMWNTPSETAARSRDSEEVGRARTVSLQFATGIASQGLEYELDVLKESSRESSLEGLDSIQSVA